jgi:hypothetical protein
MAKPFRSAIDLSQNELLNPRAQQLAAAPGSPVTGQFWYNTTSGRIEYRGAGATIDPTARANHSGTQLAATISDFDTQVRTSKLNQMAAPAADVSFGSFKITNLANGSSAQDAATYGQLLGLVNGLDWKASVRAATTANITLSGPQTIDGVSVIAGDRVLVKNQSTASQNGIYVVAAGAWTRATDAAAGTLTSSAAAMVSEGTTNADSQWRLTTDDPITVDTTALTWTQIGAAVSYTQGTGISIAGNVVAIDTSTVVRKLSATIGNGALTSIPVTHSLGTRDITVCVYDAATYEEIGCDVVHTDANTVTLGFAAAPASNSLRVVVHG